MARKKSFPLRIDPKLYEALARWAADELRSVNAHIEFLLREAALRAGRLPVKHSLESSDELLISARSHELPLENPLENLLENAREKPQKNPQQSSAGNSLESLEQQ